MKINYVKWIKLCVAVPLAMLIAQVLKLDYASSAGVITLLTVLDTRQETFAVAWKRVGAFGIMSILCKLAFGVGGCNIPAHAVFLCLFLLVCYLGKPDMLDTSYKEAELPRSREEFENRAELWHILRCLEVLLRKKQDFVKDLTQEEKILGV